MNRNNLKKQLKNNHNRILKLASAFRNDDFVQKSILHLKSVRGDCGDLVVDSEEHRHENDFRLHFKLQDMNDFMVSSEEVYEEIIKAGITDEDTINQILNDLEDGDTSFTHAWDNLQDNFGDCVDDFEYYTRPILAGKNGREFTPHDLLKQGLVLKDCVKYSAFFFKFDSEFEGTRNLYFIDWEYKKKKYRFTERNGVPYVYSTMNPKGYIDPWEYNHALFDAEEQGLKYYFRKSRDKTLAQAVEISFDILKYFLSRVQNFRNDARPHFEKLQEAVNFYNQEIQVAHMEQLRYDIQEYIDANDILLDDTDDDQKLSKLKLQTIAKIEDNQLTTDLGASVPLNEARNVLAKFMEGLNIVGDKVGAYQVKRIINIGDAIIIRIGCHLIKIDAELKNQLA